MKKTIILLFTGLLSFGVSAQSFGLKGGINMANAGGDDADILGYTEPGVPATSVAPSMFIGPMFGAFMQFGDGAIRYTVEATYTQKGAEYEGSLTSADANYYYLGSQLEAKLSAGFIDLGIMGNFHVTDEFSINAGPYLGIRTNYKEEVKITWQGQTILDINSSDDDGLEQTEFGGNIGFSYWINDMLLLDARYCMGFTSMSDDADVFTRNMQVGVSYLFSY